MNILQVFPGNIWGGAEQYVLDLGTALEEAGHRVFYMARDHRPLRQRLEGKDVRFVGSLKIRNPRAASMLCRTVRDHEIDLVHIHDVKNVPFVFFSLRKCGRMPKVVVTRHIARPSKTALLARPYFRKLHNIIFVSGLSRRLWMGANPWMPAEKCRVVCNSIPDVRECSFTGESLRGKYNISNDVPLLVYTGRVRRSKGCSVIVEALSRLRNLPFHMVFIGNLKPQSYGEELMDLARKGGVGDRVSLYGFSDRVRQLIREADIGLAPSIVREACPLSPMEFMQAGKCVVASDNGAQPEYIRNMRTGILVPPDDVEKLTEALETVIVDKNLRESIGRNACEYFHSEMNYSKFVSRILDCYKA